MNMSVMKGFCILLLSMLTILLMSNAFSSVEVKLHDAATLPCKQTCSGRITWTVFHKPHDILAQCNQTSCWSKEGFHMSHDQYLKGDFSLTITDTDYSKRTLYTCECDDVEICDVIIRIEPVNIFTHVRPGESLIMDVPISQPVEVILNRTGDTKPNTVRLCEITGREIQCLSEYKNRVSFSISLQLKEMNISDSGIYTIRDTRNEEVIATYTVNTSTVEGQQEIPNKEKTHMLMLKMVLPLVSLVLLVIMIVIVWLRRKLPKYFQTNTQQNEGTRDT